MFYIGMKEDNSVSRPFGRPARSRRLGPTFIETASALTIGTVIGFGGDPADEHITSCFCTIRAAGGLRSVCGALGVR